MPTRLERLKKRSTKVADKTARKVKKAGVPVPGSRSARVLNRGLKKGAKIDKKIANTKARVAKRAKKKAGRIVKRGVRKMNKGKPTPAAYRKLMSKYPQTSSRKLTSKDTLTAAQKKSAAIKKARGGVKGAAKKAAGPTYISTFGTNRR
mgnify:CR=1 FL=1